MNKILIVVIAMVLTCLNIKAQGYGEDEPIDNVKRKAAEISQSPFNGSGDTGFEFCEIVGMSKFFSNKVNVFIDYGQDRKLLEAMTLIKDEKGNTVAFNSMVDALNYMGKLGWEFSQAYVVSMQGQNVYHWLLKRKRKQ